MERILEVEGTEQKLVVEVRYSLGGYHHGTGGIKKRGYYLHAQPTTFENGWRKFTAFTGVQMLLVEVGRKSNKRYEEACDMVTDELIERLKAQCKFS